MTDRALIWRTAAVAALGAILAGSIAGVVGARAFWQSWTEEADRLLKAQADAFLETGSLQAVAGMSGEPVVCRVISTHGPGESAVRLQPDWPAGASVGLREGGSYRTVQALGQRWRMAAVVKEGRGVKLAVDLAPVIEEMRYFAWQCGVAVAVTGCVAGAAAGMWRLGSLRRAAAERVAQAGASADAAHELRSPLAAIQARINLARLQSQDESPLVDSLLEDLSAEVARTRDISDAILLLARADAGTLRPERLPVRLGVLLSELSDETAAEHEEAGLSVSVDCPPDLVVPGDPRLLRLAVSNLLRNAAAYNFTGGFVKTAARRAGRMAEMTITNSGPPIANGDKEVIFRRFRRGAAGAQSGVPGSGLGLSLSRAICEAHGGSVQLVASDAAGTVFRVSLPAASGEF